MKHHDGNRFISNNLHHHILCLSNNNTYNTSVIIIISTSTTTTTTNTTTLWGIKKHHNFFIITSTILDRFWQKLMCSVLDKLTTKYHKIFQLHLNNVATLPWKHKVAFFDKLKWNDVKFAFKFEVRTKKCPCKNKRSTDKQLFQLIINCSKCYPLAWTYALSLGRHWLMALSMMLCLNSAQTEIKRCCFCKVVWRRYLGENFIILCV